MSEVKVFHVGHNFELATMAALAHMAEKEFLGTFYRGRDGTNADHSRNP